jgi:hypothetical protein
LPTGDLAYMMTLNAALNRFKESNDECLSTSLSIIEPIAGESIGVWISADVMLAQYRKSRYEGCKFDPRLKVHHQ